MKKILSPTIGKILVALLLIAIVVWVGQKPLAEAALYVLTVLTVLTLCSELWYCSIDTLPDQDSALPPDQFRQILKRNLLLGFTLIVAEISILAGVIALSHTGFAPLLACGIMASFLCLGHIIDALARFRAELRKLREYSKNCQTCGFLPPAPSDQAHRLAQHIASIICQVFIGNIEVSGIEHLSAMPPGSSFIVTPNHPNMLDVVVLPKVLGSRKARYMATDGVMRVFAGLGAHLFARIGGAFAVNIDKGKGAPAAHAAVEVLVTGQTLVMWPEGWTYLDGKTGKFKKGAVRIVKEAAAKLGQTTYIVPVHLRYGKYPGQWIMKLPIHWQYLLLVVAFPFFRSGVKVVFGQAIASSSLPTCNADASELLRNTVIALDKL